MTNRLHQHVIEALARMKHITDYINKEKRFAENFQKLTEIQGAFGNELVQELDRLLINIRSRLFRTQFLTKSPQREFLKEGDYLAKKKGYRGPLGNTEGVDEKGFHPLTAGSRKGWNTLHYFLFNDVLIFARPR